MVVSSPDLRRLADYRRTFTSNASSSERSGPLLQPAHQSRLLEFGILVGTFEGASSCGKVSQRVEEIEGEMIDGADAST